MTVNRLVDLEVHQDLRALEGGFAAGGRRGRWWPEFDTAFWALRRIQLKMHRWPEFGKLGQPRADTGNTPDADREQAHRGQEESVGAAA